MNSATERWPVMQSHSTTIMPRQAHRVAFLSAFRGALERLGWTLGVTHNHVLPHGFGPASFVSLACYFRFSRRTELLRKFSVCPQGCLSVGVTQPAVIAKQGRVAWNVYVVVRGERKTVNYSERKLELKLSRVSYNRNKFRGKNQAEASP